MQHFANFGIVKQRNKIRKKTEGINKEFYDIRKTNDTAASESGYLGFRKDPYKGYGGMMEEPVPIPAPAPSPDLRNPILSTVESPYTPNTPAKQALVKKYNQKQHDFYLGFAQKDVGQKLEGKRGLKQAFELSGGNKVSDKYLGDYPIPSQTSMEVIREDRKRLKDPLATPIRKNIVRDEFNDTYLKSRVTGNALYPY